MLSSLRIKNFAIVSELELDFNSGMTVFTGETGAGKSIMVDALMLALGGRSDATIVRNGAKACEVCASFSIDEESAPANWLRLHELNNDEQEIILRRIISAEGRSKSYINGQPFPLQKVKELSEMLVDIHGQHQHQTLLQHHTHRQQLDQFAQHLEIQEKVKSLFTQYQEIKNKLTKLSLSAESKDNRDDLQFQLNELESLALQENELSKLHREHQLLHHACSYLEHTNQIQSILNADESPNIQYFLNQVLQKLNSLPQDHKAIKIASELINNALIQIEETIHEINQFAKEIHLDPEKLSEIEARVSQIHQIARKYHIEANQIPDLINRIKEQLGQLSEQELKRQALAKELDDCLESYTVAAKELTLSRQKYAKKLAEEITTSIKQLGMPKGYVTINITPLEQIQIHGCDKVEYIVCTNPGMTPDSLAKVVSGGELSRIGLAIHVITAKRGATPTLVFDEVDVGIGGATAALVGKLLRNLGERLQVFCVTHQPQVAASAHHHFLVEKFNEAEQTFSKVINLDNKSKVEEIARMLGGLTVTEQTRSNAKELLEEITS